MKLHSSAVPAVANRGSVQQEINKFRQFFKGFLKLFDGNNSSINPLPLQSQFSRAKNLSFLKKILETINKKYS